MSDGLADDPGSATPPPTVPTAPRGHPLAAWLVIGLVVGFVLFRHATEAAGPAGAALHATLELQVRYLVGVADLFGQRNELIYGQAKEALGGEGYDQRLGLAVLAGELVGPAEARKVLSGLPDEAGADKETAEALDAIYRALGQDPPAEPPPGAVARVRERLGWIGDLAAAAPGTPDAAARAAVLRAARRAAVVSLAAITLGLLADAAGLVALVAGAALAAAGHLRPRLATGSPYGGVYAETFAVWMVLFVALNFAARLVPAGSSWLLVTGVLDLASLAALAWPAARGVPWAAAREDLGLTPGPRPAVELAAGVGTYVAALPLLVVGVVATLALRAAARRLGLPDDVEHPLGVYVIRSGWWGRAQALLVAGVVAPIVEETMFRGVLYRHLRECTAGMRRAAGFVLSALAVSFVFAVIHPQGWLAVPPLMSLAFAFCLAREWRGTLLPAMVAHGVNNIAVTALVILAAA